MVNMMGKTFLTRRPLQRGQFGQTVPLSESPITLRFRLRVAYLHVSSSHCNLDTVSPEKASYIYYQQIPENPTLPSLSSCSMSKYILQLAFSSDTYKELVARHIFKQKLNQTCNSEQLVHARTDKCVPDYHTFNRIT